MNFKKQASVFFLAALPFFAFANTNFNRGLSIGSTGEDVQKLQQILGEDDSIYPEKLVTGYFGRLTQKAVMVLQEKLGLEVVGTVGPKTRAFLNSIAGDPKNLLAAAVRSDIGAGSGNKLPTPTNLTATNVKSTYISLRWDDVYTPDVTNYELERSDGNDKNFVLRTNNIISGVHVVGDSVSSSTTYYYRVRSVKSRPKLTYSAYSNIYSTTTPAFDPVLPTPTATSTQP